MKRENSFKLKCKKCGKDFGYCDVFSNIHPNTDNISSIQFAHNNKIDTYDFFCSEECFNAYYKEETDNNKLYKLKCKKCDKHFGYLYGDLDHDLNILKYDGYVRALRLIMRHIIYLFCSEECCDSENYT